MPAIIVSNGLYAYDDFVTPASLSSRIMTGLLRRKLGFEGVTLTGDLTDPAVTALEPPRRSAVQALRAGADLLYLSAPATDQAAAYRSVLTAVRKKRVSTARLDEAQAAEVDTWFVTTDPARDDPATLRAYLDRFDPEFEGLTGPLTDIVETARAHLASYQKPRSVEFVAELPKAPTGKILKKDLRAPYWQDRDSQVV